MGAADEYALLAAIAATALDLADNVADLKATGAANRHVTDELRLRAPALYESLRTRYSLRAAHLYATGKVEPDPLPPEPETAPAHPANAIRKRRPT